LPSDVKALDLRGRYIVPGLIDAHVHLENLRALRSAVESGATTVRSAGVAHYADVGLRELVKQGSLAGPDVFASGYQLRPMLAEEAFLTHPDLAGLLGGVTSIEALLRIARVNKSHSVDWIKVLATERAGTPETDPRKQTYTESELRAIVEDAKGMNLPVQAHAHGDEGAFAAVRAGVRSIEHGTYLSEDALRLMAKQGTFLDPTIEVVKDMTEPGGDYDHRDLQLRGRQMLPRLCETVGRAYKLGVTLRPAPTAVIARPA
jgi:imidazolonepropionase-like amidohydrolase